MSICVSVKAGNVLQLDPSTPTTQCAYLLISQGDPTNPANLPVLFDTYFAFDVNLWGLIVGSCLLTFVSGHILGRILQAWQRHGM